MAKTRRTASSQKTRKKKKSSTGAAFRIASISLIMVVLLKHSFIFLIAGMLPSIIALIVDRSQSQLQFRTVAAMNFSGVAPYMAMLWRQDNSSAAVQSVMADPNAWLIMYSAAAFGWGIVLFSPYFIRSAMSFFSDNKIHRIEMEQQELIEEWGAAVAADNIADLGDAIQSDSDDDDS